MATPVHDLSIEARLKLVEDIWDSIAAEQQNLRLTAEQRTELDDRLNEFEVDGELGEPANQVIAKIRAGL